MKFLFLILLFLSNLAYTAEGLPTPDQAWQRLKEGNQRFLSGKGIAQSTTWRNWKNPDKNKHPMRRFCAVPILAFRLSWSSMSLWENYLSSG